jgi:hypothetical protein
MPKLRYRKDKLFWYFIWDPKEDISLDNGPEVIEGYFGIDYRWGTKNKDTVKGICKLYEKMLKHALATGRAWGISVYETSDYTNTQPIAVLGNVETGFTEEFLAAIKLPAQEYFDKEFEKWRERRVKG